MDGLVLRYGDAAYIGPPQVIRQQIWVVPPAHRLALSALPDGALISASLKSGYLENNYDYRTGEKSLWGSFDYYPLDRLITPNWQDYPGDPSSSLFFAGDLEVIGTDQVAGREAIVIDWTSTGSPGSFEGEPPADRSVYLGRYWVDALTGVILRHQEFSPTQPDLLIGEVLVTAIAYNVEIPGRLFDILAPLPTRLARDHLGEPLPEGYVWDAPPLTRREPLPRIPPPPDFDPAHSRLSFQRSEREREGAGDLLPVEIFADRYYLGTLLMGDLFKITCVRSPDGRYLAYAFQTDNPGYSSSPLYLLDLANLIQRYTPLTQPMIAFYSFSPDSRQVTWSACDDSGLVCDLGRLDTESGEMAVMFRFNRLNQVIDIASGKVIGRISGIFSLVIEIDEGGEFNQVSGFFPGERITIDMGTDFAAQPGLEACAKPPDAYS